MVKESSISLITSDSSILHSSCPREHTIENRPSERSTRAHLVSRQTTQKTQSARSTPTHYLYKHETNLLSLKDTIERSGRKTQNIQKDSAHSLSFYSHYTRQGVPILSETTLVIIL